MANIKYRKSDGTYETITNYNVQPLVPVQETGDSVIDVMSQKAVTDAINNITVEAGQNIDVKDKVISAKGYLYNENDANFYIGDKEENEKIFKNLMSSANLTSISEIQNLNLVSELSDTTETPEPLFDNVYWEEGSNIIQHDHNGGGLKGLIVKIQNSTEQLIATIITEDKDNKTVTLDKNIPFNSEGAYVYSDFGCYGRGSVATSIGVASGIGSFASGLSSVASGIASNSKGFMTYAWGDFSYAEGAGTVVEGLGGHSEGFVTRSIGEFSHAEGVGTVVEGLGGHSEGSMTRSIGEFSHAEGNEVISYGDGSHAEGIGKDFLGINVIISGTELTIDSTSVSMGTPNCLVINKNNTLIPFKVLSENEGIYTIDKDLGQYNGVAYIRFGLSYGKGSHAEGCSISIGDCSHSEGDGNTAFGKSSHVEGCLVDAFGNYSHVEGYSSQAYGDGSHAEGNNTTASGHASHAEGHYTKASGDFSHTEGDETIANNYAEHAEGRYNVSNIDTIHSIGIGKSTNARQNAHEIMLNGDHYIYGIGDYDGTNPNDSQTLQQVINNQQDIIYTRTYTLDFGTSSDLIQDINMIGNITINNIQTYNVNKLFITYGNVVHSEITNFTDMGISIDKNSRIIWEIERINDEELACVGIESKINN